MRARLKWVSDKFPIILGAGAEASIKLRGSWGFFLGFSTAHFGENGSLREVFFHLKIFILSGLSALSAEKIELFKLRNRVKRNINFIQRIFIITIVAVNSLFSNLIFAQEQGKTHFRFLNQNEQFNIGDSFYRNSDYFKCQAKQQCPVIEDPNVEPKRYAYFLGREEDGVIIPVFLQCFKSGNSTITSAEDLIPLLNEDVLQNGDCLEAEELEETVPNRFVEDTLKAVRSYEGKCPKNNEDKNMAMRVFDSFFGKDLKTLGSMITGRKGQETKTGCLGNIISNIADSLYQTVKMFLWDLPKGIWNIGRAGYRYFFGAEEERSTSMLASSVMNEDMAKALTEWDLTKFYGLLRKNFFDFFGSVKEYYTETIGCTEWDGIPYNSNCTKKMNWTCPSLDNTISYFCGMASQLGTGFFLGALLGSAKSLAKMKGLRRKITDSPEEFGIVGKSLEELKSKMNSNEQLSRVRDETRRARFRMARKNRTISDFLGTQVAEMKFILGLGDSFKNLVKATPITNFYHKSFQAGQQRGWKAINEFSVKNVENMSPAMKIARSRALRLDNIQEKFDELFADFNKLKGDKFDPILFKEVQDELFTSMSYELRKTGLRVERLPEGRGLKISKGDESFNYEPRLEEKVRNLPDNLSDDSFKDSLVNGDLILGKQSSVSLGPDTPDFWREFTHSAEQSRGLFTLKSNGMDGFVYLGQFSAQTGSKPRVEDCSAKLNNVEVLRSQDITDIDTDGREHPVEEEPTVEEVPETSEESAQEGSPASE